MGRNMKKAREGAMLTNGQSIRVEETAVQRPCGGSQHTSGLSGDSKETQVADTGRQEQWWEMKSEKQCRVGSYQSC